MTYEEAVRPRVTPAYDGGPKVRRILAIHSACSDYHSGMGSRGYRLLCLCDRRLRKLVCLHWRCLRKVHDEAVYLHVAAVYGDKL